MFSITVKLTSLLIFISLLFSDCKSSQRTISLRNQYKTTYINQFKLTYFRQFLKKAYNNSASIKEIINNDHSGFTEIILLEDDYILIDSLTTADNLKMVYDSSQGQQRAEGAQGKRPLGYILHIVESKWLDSIAKRRLKISGVPESWMD